jgi:hypothetical protein
MVKEEILFELVSMKTRRINIRVSESYIKRLNNIKKRTGVTISEMIRRGLILYLDKYEI